jgi:hypothetical protein
LLECSKQRDVRTPDETGSFIRAYGETDYAVVCMFGARGYAILATSGVDSLRCFHQEDSLLSRYKLGGVESEGLLG